MSQMARAKDLHRVRWCDFGKNAAHQLREMFDEAHDEGYAFVGAIPVETGTHVVFRSTSGGLTGKERERLDAAERDRKKAAEGGS